MEASSSNSSNQFSPWKYHVFLSFRGEDTRNGFASHLYAALKENGILTFKDDEELEKGEVISQELVKAIQESLFAIVILPPNYPSSSWCLDELQEILKSRRIFNRQVFPLFYGVDPSHVRHQKENFAEVFKRLKERFGEDSIKVQKWREALKEISNLAGWDSRNLQEAKLIDQIVREICIKLQPLLPSLGDEMVGIDSKINEVYSFLRVNEKNDARFIGIWGMGGVGKTTLARAVYEIIKNQFDGSCFLQDVKEVSDREGLVKLQRMLLSDLKVKDMKVKDLYDGKKTIRNLLCNKRILLVLDDVSAVSQLENLAGNQKWFGQGSRVIITTRNKQVMKTYGHEAFEIYKVKHLNSSESLQLFFQKAFKGDHPKEEYFGLSESVVRYAGGLPLALEVLGSFLCGRSIHKWKDTLDMLKQCPQDDILKKLRLSYDGLEYNYKTIFLDIACFFKGWNRNHVTHILYICGRNPTIGIEVLMEKSLVTFDGQNLGMHDLLQDLGKHIVLQESLNDVSERSRLWHMEDIDHVLAKNKGTKTIEGIVLNLFEPYKVHWNPDVFSKICNLKLLILKTDLCLSNGLNCLSDGLRVLEWERCPLKSLPLGIGLNDLVDIKLRHSKVKQLWDGIKVFQKLKFIDLSHSEYLIQTPNISGVPNLEILILEGCTNLVEVHQSIQQHKKLVILNLKDCLNLKVLPNKLEMNSLENFILSGCSKIKKLPKFGDNMECLLMLDLKDCKNLLCLPNTIHNLKSLKILNISGCSKFSRLPSNLNENEALEDLDASGTAIGEVPSSIVQLRKLQNLSFRGCKGLPSNYWDITLPFRWFQKFQRHPNPMGLMLPSMSQMPMLKELDLSYCNLGDGSLLDDLGRLSLLKKLDLSGNNFVNLPTNSIASLLELDFLNLNNCARLQSLPTLPPILRDLELNHCARLQSLPTLPPSLGTLQLNHCARLQSLPTLPPILYNLQLNHCARLQSLPTLPRILGDLELNHCARLQSLPTLPPSLGTLQLNHCARLQSLPTLPPSLAYLQALDCASMQFLSYSQLLQDFFTSIDYEISGRRRRSLLIPGSEIPTWFDNQNYCSEDVPPEFPHCYDLLVSIIVDIPDHCRWNKSWGIAFCLVLEYTSSPNLETYWVCCSCRVPEADFSPLRVVCGIEKFNYPHLLIHILWDDDWRIKQCLIGDKNQLEFIFYSRSDGAKEEAKLKIRKCGWRLLWKDNVEMWGNALTEPKCIISNVQCQQDVFEEDDATLSKRQKLY